MSMLSDERRIQALKSYHIIGTEKEKEFDDLTQIAGHICGTPTALVTFLDDEKQYIKSKIGFDDSETLIKESFCQFCIDNLDELTIISGAKKDPRFLGNKYVHGEKGFDFYVGAPLITKEGYFLGTLCVLDHQSRSISDQQKSMLKILADQVIQILELRKNKIILQEKVSQMETENLKFKNILKTTNIGTWEWNLLTGKLTLNGNWKNLMGFDSQTQEVHSREEYEKLIHPQNIESNQLDLNTFLKGDYPIYQSQYKLKHKNGHYISVLDQGQITKWKGHEPELMFGTITDISQLVQVTEEIGQQDKKFKLLVENSQDAFGIINEEGAFSYISPTGLKILGSEKQKNFNPNFLENIHSEDREKFLEHVLNSKKHPGIAMPPIRIQVATQNDLWIWLSVTLTNWLEDALIQGIVINFKDISQEVSLEKLLENASKLARVGAWEVNLENGEITWSEITREIHEVSTDYKPTLEEAIQFYRDDYQELVQNQVNSLIETGKPFDFECPIITAKGKERWVRAIGEGVFTDIKCVKILGSFQDIHERKIAENQLKGLSDNLPGVIFQYTLHPDGTDSLDHVSLGSHKIWEMSPQECQDNIQEIWDQIKPAGDYLTLVESIQTSAYKLTPWTCEWRHIGKDGKIRWHQGFGKPQPKSDGRIVWDSLIMDVTEKKHLENLLTQTAKMSKIGSWEIDPQQRPYFLSWSDTTQEILESDYQGVELEMAFMVYSDEFKERARIVMKELLEEGKPFDEEVSLITPKGNVKWVRVIGQAVVVNEKVTYVFGSFQDIHDQKIAQLQLKDLLEEKTQLLDSIGDGFFTINKNHDFTYFNPTAEKYFEKKREEVLAKNIWKIIDKNQVPLTFQNFEEAWNSKKIRHFEEYYPDFNRWFSISVYPSNKGLTVYFKDESKAILAEEEIRKSNERFQIVSEATNDAIWDYDIEHDVLFWGKGFETLFHYDLQKIQPSLEFLLSLIHQEDRARVKEKIQKTFEDPEINNWNEEYRFLKGDGTYAYVIDRAKFIKDAKGKPKRAMGAMTDITARYEYQKSLEKINKELDQKAESLASINSELEQFAYVVSHDLQEPLRMITSFLSLLEKRNDSQLDEKSKTYISFAKDGAVRMRKLILDLLEFSKIGNSSDKPEKFNFSDLVNESLLLQQRFIREKNAEIIVEGDMQIHNLKTPLLQLITNLLSNGLKYAKDNERPVIEISCQEQGKNWSMTVKDNGIGIEEEYYEKIFFLFQRLENRSKNEDGTGLGLAIVKKIVDRLNGKIEVQSKVGEGSTFTVTIPK
ncbi:PAS domain-containing protein [Algoriphagus algorifonticola]|uniref:PAS domain-containing protein n=1 Tax=Algoriphagus algorifonticola TaxID=2593007 RepID=UPI0011A171AE|nr:PAS domain-containing protein [Algoriphagus algorifonticola]